MHKYIASVADKYDLRRNMRFQHQITGAYWNDDEGKWHIHVEHNGVTTVDVADIFIRGEGILK